MNLADIRKKAEESRRYTSVTSVVALNDSAQLPESDATEPAAIDEFVSTQSETQTEDLPEEFFVAADQLHEPHGPDLTSTVFCPDESFTEPSSVLNAETVASNASCQSQPAVIVPKRMAGYNPLETILSGRESATDAEDNALFQAAPYSSPEDVEEYLCFRVADEVYAISIMAIKEIVKPREVTEVPRMPLFISGVLSLRGVIIPVMDMRLRLSLSLNAATGRERIVVLRKDSGFCGVLVDEVIQVARINRADIEPPPAVLDGIDRDFVTGLGHFDNRMIILLNLESILDIGVH